MRYFVKTFGCQMNVADSERVAAMLEARGMTPAADIESADYVVINTCMVRQSAENRIYGLSRALGALKEKSVCPKIILTGCMVGLAVRDESGKLMRRLREKLPVVDEFLPIEEAGFDFAPIRQSSTHALVPISNGCNNFCAYCIVPYTRGREISRPFEDIINECRDLKVRRYEAVTLVGQNVNSYKSAKSKLQNPNYKLGQSTKVSAKGRFPDLLHCVAAMEFEKVDFVSSNPWDFSDELIEVIAAHPNISRTIHLPVQSGDDEVLRRMNRCYTADEYLKLIEKIRRRIPSVIFTTDIIVGFPGETEAQFKNTVKLAEKVGFADHFGK